MVIDSHIHIGGWNNPDFFGIETDIDTAIRELLRLGIGGAVLMPGDKGENEELLEAIRRKRREGCEVDLYFFPWLKRGDPDLLDFLWREKGEIRGLKFHPSLESEPLNAPSLIPFIEFAGERNIPISVHCGRWREVAGYEIALEVAKGHRGVNFILGHGGGDSPPLFLGASERVAAERLENVFFDLAGIREFLLLERAIRRAGSERYLFASDFPLGHPLIHLDMIRVMPLSERERERILYKNISGLLGAGSSHIR